MYFVRFVLFCADAVNDFLDKNCPYIAGAISFYSLFSIFPLFLALISILGFVLGPDAERTELAKDIAEVVPVSTEYIQDTLEGVVRTRAITGAASLLGLLWASSAAFGAIRKGINFAWGIKKTRPFLKERLIDIGLVVGAGLMVMVFLFAGPVLGIFRGLIEAVAPEFNFAGDALWEWVTRGLSPIFAFLAFLTLYRYIPNTETRFRDIWMGALAASLVFDGATLVFLWYTAKIPVYNAVYGPVGAIIALLTWVYVSAIILLFGALVTSRYAACAASRDEDEQGFKIIWAGLTRVRLRVVAEPSTAG